MGVSRRLVALVVVGVWAVAACGSSTGGERTEQGGGSSSGSGGATAGSAGSSAGMSGSNAGSGGSGAGSGGSSESGGSGGASGSGASSNGGELACGDSVCSEEQYCVFPCCGGAPPPCFPAPQSAMCPAGSHVGYCFGGVGCTAPNTCCQYDPCVPPPPYCSDTAPVGCITQEGRTCHLGCA
jgi:hypothetical protein